MNFLTLIRKSLIGSRRVLPLVGVALCAAVQAQVGMATLSVGDLPVTLVYPTEQAARPTVMGPFELTVARDATPSPGTHHLVVMSHGTGGSPLTDHHLAAALARAGFVVAQPLHQGDNSQDTSRAGPVSWALRPNEVTQVIDALAAHPQWQGRLTLDRVGVHGMSAGGVTALALAGAQWRVLDLVRHCQAQIDTDFGFCFNGITDPQAQAARRARYESARGVPDAYLPADVKIVHGGRTPGAAGDEVRPDRRVAVVTLAVPVAAMFSAESLARIRIPVGVVSAGRDTMLVPAFHSSRLLGECRACERLADLSEAAHMDLLSPWPQSVAHTVAALHPRGGQPAAGFDPRQREAAFAAIVEFHRRELQR